LESASAASTSPVHGTGVYCTSLADETPAPRSSPTSESGAVDTITATLTIPPIVDVIVAADGSVRYVDTNTGAAPSCAETFFAFSSEALTGGQRADLAQVNAVMSNVFSGTWTPGIFHAAS